MALALFDLDETLLAGDSDYLWGQHLVTVGAVDGETYERENRRFYQDYLAGTLDIYAFSRFAFKPLASHPIAQLKTWREVFIRERIAPIMLEAGKSAIERHRNAGDEVVIITSTNRFITEPIAQLFGVAHLIAAEPEMLEGRYTGELVQPCFAQHKVDRLREWLQVNDLDLENSSAYSDSHNDIPLLSLASHPHAVDPDAKLKQYALQKKWPIISFRAAHPGITPAA